MKSWPDVVVPPVAGGGPPLRLHDTADGAVRPLGAGPTARVYVCGITPYDATHLGHAATYLAFDLVNRVLRDGGHEVAYTQNVTDVDDPLFERAARDGEDWVELGQRETELFREDMTALRVLPPDHFDGAVESIPLVVSMVERMVASGAAYVVDDETPDVYFRRDATRAFGYESGYDEATMARFFAERGGDPDRPGKRDPLDAAVWRGVRPGEPSWESPFGPGRPGWHVECAAIALHRLGAEVDVQGGGSDLVFPHHEFSAAHVESDQGVTRFARHYVHAAMIGLDGEKMSKSKGNLVLVSKLRAAGVDPTAIRLGLLAGHYRQDRAWSDAVLDEATARLARWRTAVARPTGPDADDLVARLRQHLADDLDTPRALAAVDAWAAEGARSTDSDTDPEAPADVAAAVDALLGVDLLGA